MVDVEGLVKTLYTYSDETCETPRVLVRSFTSSYDPCTEESESSCYSHPWGSQIAGCSSNDAVTTVNPNVFNYVAEEYTDASCTDPTGNTEIIPVPYNSAQPGLGEGGCAYLPYLNNYRRITECLSDGSNIEHTFFNADSTCSKSEVVDQEVRSYPGNEDICTKVGDLYYGVSSCTTDSLTTVAPTPSPTVETTLSPTSSQVIPSPSRSSESSASESSASDSSGSDKMLVIISICLILILCILIIILAWIVRNKCGHNKCGVGRVSEDSENANYPVRVEDGKNYPVRVEDGKNYPVICAKGYPIRVEPSCPPVGISPV